MVAVNFADVSSERGSRLAWPLVMILGVLPVPPDVKPCARISPVSASRRVILAPPVSVPTNLASFARTRITMLVGSAFAACVQTAQMIPATMMPIIRMRFFPWLFRLNCVWLCTIILQAITFAPFGTRSCGSAQIRDGDSIGITRVALLSRNCIADRAIFHVPVSVATAGLHSAVSEPDGKDRSGHHLE